VNDAPPREGLSEARARLIATPIVLAVLGGVLWIHHATGNPLGTYLLLGAFAAVAGAEMALLLRRAGRPAAPIETAIACAALSASPLLLDPLHFIGLLAPAIVLAALVVWVLCRHLLDTRPEAVDSIAIRLVPIVYVGLPFSFIGWFAHDVGGIVYLVLTSKASDMAGWAVGVPFGKHKMVPTVSPGKSWEGTVAGVAASVLVAVFLPDLANTSPWGFGTGRRIAFGLVVGAASILAGVIWSGWKRRLGAKDSSALIPAMGGIMDMVDSLLLAAPAAVVFSVVEGFLW
jgi:phosphatidate cytidylyltransferase